MNTPDATPPTSGLVAGKFQLEGLLGRGGMGSVWRGRHATLNTLVAIKFIEAEYANSAEARKRFDREARAAATIESKHAIKIYDHGVTDDGKPFIVMELLVGEPLDKRIDRLRQLTLQDTARIVQQVCRGLQRAHERGIVHRDLKPENVYLTRSTDDDDEVVKVLDFGIAKETGTPENPGMTSSTKTGAVLGTPYYMSPEQARGLRNVDHRTDLWSIGVIAFKCLAGRLPFEGESVGDLLVKICTSPVPVPSQVVPGLPPSFDAWFMRALERDPERRFQSAQELSDALSYAAGISARGPSSGSSAYVVPMSGRPGEPGGAGGTLPGSVPSAANVSARSGPAMTPPATAAATAPAPGMTNAPFTSSAPVPAVPSRRGTWVAVAGIAGLVLGVAVVAGTVVLKRHGSLQSSGSGLTMSPSAAGSGATAAPPLLAPPPSAAPTATATIEAPTAVAASLPSGAPAKAAPAPAGATRPASGTKPAAGAKPAAQPPSALVAPTATATATATATPTPTVKRPSNNKDPGY
jgi:serine/threonine-protein kinase